MSRRTRASTTMPSGSSKNKKWGGTDLISTTEVCALCCDTLEKRQDILKCEGSCGCNIHRYCAGVTKLYCDELVKGSIPFVYQYCALNVYKTIIQQVQDEVFSHAYGTDGDLCLTRIYRMVQPMQWAPAILDYIMKKVKLSISTVVVASNF